MQAMFKAGCPILPSADFEKTKVFYKTLGFDVAGEYSEQGYLILVRDAVEVHFFRFAEHVAQTSDHGVYFRVQDAHALSRDYEKLNLPREGIPRFGKAEEKPWGMCEMFVIDVDGNLLRMGHVLEA